MEKWKYNSLALNGDDGWLVSFTHWSLYTQAKSTHYPPNMWIDGSQSQSGWSAKEVSGPCQIWDHNSWINQLIDKPLYYIKVPLPLKNGLSQTRPKCRKKGRWARPFTQHDRNTLAMLQDVYCKNGAARKLESPTLQALAICSWHLAMLSTARESVFKSAF